MAFSTTSFFAGVGTVFAAVTIGFAGGALITTSPKPEPNRLERVAASNPVTPVTVAAAPKTESAVPSVPAARAEAPPVPAAPIVKAETTTAPSTPMAKTETPDNNVTAERVISMTQAPTSPQSTAQPPASAQVVAPALPPVVAKDDTASAIENAKKVRESELRKQAEWRASERRAEQRRRKHQEIEAAVNAVKRMQRDGVLQQVSQEQQDDTPRFGFFGRD